MSAKKSIDSFYGKYAFLCNFHECPKGVLFDGMMFPTSEHAFAAAKTTSHEQRQMICNASSPGVAKRLGRQVDLRHDWEEIKTEVMKQIVMNKFSRDKHLRLALLQTGDMELIEGNTWGDTIWGKVNGRGQNRLGKILMEVRTELRAAIVPDACLTR